MHTLLVSMRVCVCVCLFVSNTRLLLALPNTHLLNAPQQQPHRTRTTKHTHAQCAIISARVAASGRGTAHT